MTSLGEWIKRSGLTHEQFGELIGRDHSAVGRYIRGERMPNPTTLRRIFQATKGEVSANDFALIEVEGAAGDQPPSMLR